MNLRQAIPGDVTASAIAHLLLLALVFVFSDVHPFGAVTAEPIAVDIVTPQQVAEKAPEPAAAPTPEPQPDLPLPDKPAENSAAAAAPQQPAPAQPAMKQAASPPPPPSPPPAARPARQQVAATQPPAQPALPPPAYTPPEPDLSIKYHVMLGLPPELPAAPSAATPRSTDKTDENFDAAATRAADIASTLVAEFRRHLRACSKLPAQLRSADDVRVKLRVSLTPAGKLAADPVLIEASASAKGPLLMRSAITALEACQPYTMLPADRYGEWKVIDLSFTPQDFSS
jgi:hypothetical protein